ncbi:MAG TPA: ABC transporter permease [Gemmatimonadaceae bacterium]|nr:ABC transporter permease [Gemmatimonadaceae bacterium]
MDKKMFIVTKREYMERVRSRWFVAVTLLVPVLIAAATLFPMYVASRSGASNSVRHITILDATGAGLGERVAKSLMTDSTLAPAAGDTVAPRVLNVTPAEIPAREQAAAAEVQLPRHIVGYLVLTDSTLAGKSARYAGRNASTIGDMDKLRTAVRQEVMMTRLEREGVRKEIVNDLATNTLRLNSERLTERGRSGSGTAGIFAGISVAILLFMSIVFHGQNIPRGVLEEKSTRVAEVVLSSIKPETLLAGKVLGVGGVGLTQQIAWFAIAAYLMNFLGPIITKGAAKGAGAAAAAATANSTTMSSLFGGLSLSVVGVALAFFVIGFVFYASLYAAAGSMVNSEQEAQQAQMPVMILLMSTWLLVNPVLVNPNSTLANVLTWLPWSAPIIVPLRMGLTTLSPIVIVGSIVVTMFGCVASLWLSARIYRVGMLMYGKKPSFAEVAKWIRYA